MKIGVSSYSFNKYMKATEGITYLDVCRMAKEMGYDGIEFIGLDTEKYSHGESAVECAAEIRKYCEEIGLEIIAYAVGANLLADNIEEEIEKLCACVDVAAALGAPLMRHDVCSKLPEKPLYNWRDALNDMVPSIRRVTEYAKSKGIRTCTENHGKIFQAPERVEELIRTVGNENYGWLCDIGNFLCADVDPLKAVAVAAPYAIHVHAKDFIFKSAVEERPEGFFDTLAGNHLRGTVLGHGIVPVAACIKLLQTAGYNGWLSLEFEGLEDNLTAVKMGHDYLRAHTAKG